MGDRAEWTTGTEFQAQIIDELRLANRLYLQAHGAPSQGQFVATARPESLTRESSTREPEPVSFSAFVDLLKE